MANVFGRGYYTDWESMIVGIKKGLQEAFEMACEEICERGDEYIRGAIYSNNMGESYDDFRTYEMGAINYLQYHINGLDCYFTFDNEDILTLSKENPVHHALTDDSGNGYDAESFVIQVINDHDDKQFVDEIKDFIQREFPTIYRNCCRKLNITL